jgi:glycine/D-amino acid oxidase-like deaminating enzyme
MAEPSRRSRQQQNWGQTPWEIDFHLDPLPLPTEVDLAVVGGGFTGLAVAAWLRHLAPGHSVAVFEADALGAGSSGHTGGLALAGTAGGDLPGLGDVLAGFTRILRDLDVSCDLTLPGVWELDRAGAHSGSQVAWTDSGLLGVANEVSGGTIDPGKLVSGLARAASSRGVPVFQNARVSEIRFAEPLALSVRRCQVRAREILIATNAASLDLSGLTGRAQPKFTLALATAPVDDSQLQALGLSSGKPFYTIDLPYLWGRLLRGNRIIFGSGLVHLRDWRELSTVDITSGEAAEHLRLLERRVHALHPALSDVQVEYRWGGPILIAEEWQPVFERHPKSPRVIVLGAYSGHGVALSVYLGAWAAEAILGRRTLPDWNSAQLP